MIAPKTGPMSRFGRFAAPQPRLALMLGLALVLGLGPACDEPPGALDEHEVQACARRAAAALAEHADLELPELPPILLLTASEARARRLAYVEGLADSDETGFTRAVDLMADQVMGDNMLGRYLPDEQVVYVFEEVLVTHSRGDPEQARKALFGLLAHELVHAYDDVVYGVMPAPDDLLEFLEDPSGLTDVQTLMSLLEGRAAYASELACLGAGEEPLHVPTAEEVRGARMLSGDGSVSGDVLATLGNAVARVKLMQYAQGYEFSRRAWDYGGQVFFEHVFSALPLSLEELEDFDAFRLRWAEDLEERLLAEEDAADAAARRQAAEPDDP